MNEPNKDKQTEELEQVIAALRNALWDILYADQDNYIPDDLHKQAVAALDRERRRTDETHPRSD
jgi:hypothetical protein